jgi:hypothetical protein
LLLKIAGSCNPVICLLYTHNLLTRPTLSHESDLNHLCLRWTHCRSFFCSSKLFQYLCLEWSRSQKKNDVSTILGYATPNGFLKGWYKLKSSDTQLIMWTKTLVAGFALFSTHVSASSTGTTTFKFDPRAPVRCPPGQYAKTSGGVTSCFNCLAGSYNDSMFFAHRCGHCLTIVFTDTGATSCTLAAAGYYVPTAAATAESTCTPGSYSGMTGSIACSDCTAGHYCPNTAMATPSACAAGSYSPGGQVSKCTKCDQGTFTGFEGSSSCCPCCANFYAVGCLVCPCSFLT